MTKIIEIILVICTVVAVYKIKKAWKQILLAAGIIELIIKAIELYNKNPWYIWGPIIGIIILLFLFIWFCVKAYNDGF